MAANDEHVKEAIESLRHRLCNDEEAWRALCVVMDALSAQQPEAVATAWLHTVVQDDGTEDQALSFSRDSFPLQGVGGFRSIKAVPLATVGCHEILLAYENLLADHQQLLVTIKAQPQVAVSGELVRRVLDGLPDCSPTENDVRIALTAALRPDAVEVGA